MRSKLKDIFLLIMKNLTADKALVLDLDHRLLMPALAGHIENAHKK